MDDNINAIPSHLQPFLTLHCLELPLNSWKILNALNDAIKAIDGKIRIDKKYRIILGRPPLSVPVGDTNSLTCILDNDVIGLTMENIIFLDCLKLQCQPPQQTVAIILEELVHCLMNVADENLVKQIVPLLYPYVEWDELRSYWPKQDV